MKYSTENRECQNCKTSFTIEPEDFEFYAKIKVPPPTWCPECRMQRRMAWRNVRNLYKRQCSAPGHNESIISVYSADKKFTVYDQPFWWSDKYDPTMNSRGYDFSIPFFIQYAQLLSETPLPNLSNINPVESAYTNVTIDSKDCYLIFSSTHNENCLYSEGINNCSDSLDLLSSRNDERAHECVDCRNCYNIFFSTKAIGCRDSAYLYDCRNCTDCIGCWNLRNKQYCIFNEQYDKENYFDKLKSIDLGSYVKLEEIRRVHSERVRVAIRRFADIFHSENVTGDGIESSRNCRDSFDIVETVDSRYVWRLLERGGSDNYDVTIGTKPILGYEAVGGGFGHGSKFGVTTGDLSYSHYNFTCISGSKYLFGCVGLNNKSYCILNKQYTKEEYEALVPRIIQHMNDMPYINKKGRVYKYGEFFPPELSPFAYNETIAQEYFPLTKAEAESKGYRWKDPETKEYSISLQPQDLPDHIKDVPDSILVETIGCEHRGVCNEQCTTAFRLIPREVEFYRKHNFPLPRLCPNCRNYQRLKQRNPLKLWHRKCQCAGEKSNPSTSSGFAYANTTKHFHDQNPCPNEFETSYAPDRPETVYCESCYQGEVA